MANTVALGGDLTIHRLGFGAMRLTGPGVFGPPANPEAAIATLRSLRDLGVNFVDTAIAYGPMISEMLVRGALAPYEGMVVATKGGFLRPAAGQWVKDARPSALRAFVQASLSTLQVERIDLWQLHHVDEKVPFAEQVGAIAELRKEGLIRHAGLCNVDVAQIEAARKVFPVASVQNPYHVIDRRAEAVLEHCEKIGIPFIAYYPLAVGALAREDSVLGRVAARLGITPAQAALAWLLKRSPWLVPIPGTQDPAHAAENAAAIRVELSDEDYAEIEKIGRRADQLRGPRPTGSSLIE